MQSAIKKSKNFVDKTCQNDVGAKNGHFQSTI